MKKLVTFLLLAFMVSCSSEDATVDSVNSQSVESTLQNGILTFKDEKSFIGEYSKLSKMNPSELQKWISAKKVNSLLNTSNDSLVMQEEILSDSRIIYSDAMKAILNSESKFRVNGKLLWLNEGNFYELTDNDSSKTISELKIVQSELKVYGKILSLSNKQEGKANLTSRVIVPNENRVRTYVNNGPNDKRYILELFNETIAMNNSIVSTKMFLKSIMQYKSCSFWRCTYKEDTSNTRSMEIQLSHNWRNQLGSNFTGGYRGSYTLLLADFSVEGPVIPTNFSVTGFVRTRVNGYTWDQAVTWY